MLAEHGFNIGLVGRRAERLLEVARDIGEDRCLVMPADITEASIAEQIVNRTVLHFGRLDCLVMPADITEASIAEQIVHRTVLHFGRLDCLVNNAGFAPLLPIEKTTPAIIDEVYRVNAL